MLFDAILTFVLSLSPLGEARVGMPYGALKGVPLPLVFILGLTANLLVFPLFYKLIEVSNRYLWKNRVYKKSAVYLSRRAKNGTQKNFQKYGVWGLMIFVMIPLPITGAYVGTLAAFVLGIPYRKSLIAVSVGIIISCILVTVGLHFGMKALL